MALKEGRCPNCGSLIQLDSNSENGHCLFCDAVFTSQTAIEIAANPAGIEFPNLPQPKYEGPALANRQSAAPYFPANQPAVRKKTAAGKPEPEPYVQKKVKVPDVRMPLKAKILMAVIVIGIAGIFAAITIPLSARRDSDRKAILDALPAVSPIAFESESEAALRRLDNSYLMVATGENVTKEQAATLFKAFIQQRAEIRGSEGTVTESDYKGSTLRLAHAAGGYLIDSPTDAGLASGEAVKTLP